MEIFDETNVYIAISFVWLHLVLGCSGQIRRHMSLQSQLMIPATHPARTIRQTVAMELTAARLVTDQLVQPQCN